MAIGDAAAAAGLDVFPSDQDLRLGYQNDNQRGDDIAAVMVGKLDKSIIRVGQTEPAGAANGTVWVSWI